MFYYKFYWDQTPCKQKTRIFRLAFLFSSGDRNILTLQTRTSFGQDGPPRRIMEGLNKEKPSAKSALFLHFHLLLKVNLQEYPPLHFGWTSGGAYPFSCLPEFSIDVGLNTIFLFQLLLISKIRFLLRSSNNCQLF